VQNKGSELPKEHILVCLSSSPSNERIRLATAAEVLDLGLRSAKPSFSGYAMIALLENEFVEKKKWLEKSEFLDMVAVAESTPGPVAINSATYIGYKIAGFAGATMSTLAVSIPSFFVIYGISLFFDQFLSLRWVSCAFRGIQVCVIYLILTAGLKMLKSIDKNILNLTILTLVVASMLCCSITAVSFSSVFYILICGAVGLVVFFLRKIRKGDGKTS
jgi:chromate transporter